MLFLVDSRVAHIFRDSGVVMDLGAFQRVLELHIEAEFENLFKDYLTFLRFSDYFKRDIWYRAMKKKETFITQLDDTDYVNGIPMCPDENFHLSYVSKTPRESVMEYYMFVNDEKRSQEEKVYFAEKGGRHCVMYPVFFDLEREDIGRGFYIDHSSRLYDIAHRLERDDSRSELLKLVSDCTEEIVTGLENICSSLGEEGKKSLNDAFSRIKTLYHTELNPKKSKEYALVLIGLGHNLDKSLKEMELKDDDIYLALKLDKSSKQPTARSKTVIEDGVPRRIWEYYESSLDIDENTDRLKEESEKDEKRDDDRYL